MGQWMTQVENFATVHGPLIVLATLIVAALGYTLRDAIRTGAKALKPASMWLGNRIRDRSVVK
jgi:hypothetical protein